MACTACPDAVTQTLRQRVNAELNKLDAIISTTRLFNDAFGTIAGVAVAVVEAAVNAIPLPFGLSFADVLAYLTCPLTPLALGIGEDFTQLDPDTQLKKVKGLGSGEIATARRSYETALNSSPHSKLIRQCRRYEQNLRRQQFSQDSFAEALVICASVQMTCGQEEFEEGPFQRYATLAQGFGFNGGVPSSLDQNLAAMVQRLQQGETKFAALRATMV